MIKAEAEAMPKADGHPLLRDATVQAAHNFANEEDWKAAELFVWIEPHLFPSLIEVANQQKVASLRKTAVTATKSRPLFIFSP